VRRSPIRTATVVKAALAAAAFGGLVAGCAPVQMGSAATVGNDSISSSQLNSEVANLQSNVGPYQSQVQLTAAQIPKDVLGWLIRFKVRENLATSEHLNVTASQRDQALEDIYEQAAEQASQEGVNNVTLTELAVANGLPPNLLNELGRYQAIEIAYAEARNGGKLPTDTTTVNAITKQFNTAECHVYKDDSVKVNPQYGQLNYSQYSVVAAPDTLSRAGGTPAKASTSGTSPSC
jgi:outer membrane murein-binding lipoprotein Lpp